MIFFNKFILLNYGEMLPIELYREIFSQSDFATTLRFRSTCKAFSKFHTDLTRQHASIAAIEEAFEKNYLDLLCNIIQISSERQQQTILNKAIRSKRVTYFRALLSKSGPLTPQRYWSLNRLISMYISDITMFTELMDIINNHINLQRDLKPDPFDKFER